MTTNGRQSPALLFVRIRVIRGSNSYLLWTSADHCSTCHGSLVQPSRSTSVRQYAFAASRPASSSWRNRKFSNHSNTSRNAARSRSDNPRNPAKSFLQHQRALPVVVAFIQPAEQDVPADRHEPNNINPNRPAMTRRQDISVRQKL